MKLNFIGIGGAFYTELGCYAAYIKEEDKILFIDYGLDTFDKTIRYNLLNGINKIYVIITHMHGDHVGGLATFIQYAAIALNIKVKILDNSDTFSEKLIALLDIMAVDKSFYEIVKKEEFDFSFDVNLRKTKHTPMLECYSIIFSKNNVKTLYTGDSNEIDYLKLVVNDPKYEDIYTEIGEAISVHMDYKEIMKMDKTKITLMHIESEELYNKIKDKGFNIPEYLK